jgi:hypothetical protein
MADPKQTQKPQSLNPDEPNPSRPAKGMYMDSAIGESPKETYRFLLNGVDSTITGDENFVSNERSNAHITSLLDGLYCIGSVYIDDGQTAVMAVNKAGDYQEIGILDKDDVYRTHVDTKELGLKISHQVELTYRLRRGGEKTIYWVDGLNGIGTYNFQKAKDFYNKDYADHLSSGGDAYSWYPKEKWDKSSFFLVKTHKDTPEFLDVEVLEYGNIVSGSYNFAIQYVDEDLNPTGWLNTSGTVNIFVDSTAKPYRKIRGSKNLNTSAQSFSPATKSIRLTLGSLDTNFPFFRIAIIQANKVDGRPVRALASVLISTATPTFTYVGNDEALTEIPIENITLGGTPFFVPKHIEQLENKLIVANELGTKYNWCEFQQYASRIRPAFTSEPVILTDVKSEPNVKNPHSTFGASPDANPDPNKKPRATHQLTGFMPGDVASIAIVYVMPDGTPSPAFHIPGIPAGEEAATGMQFYELGSGDTYLDVHNCLDGDPEGYWGHDYTGKSLRHGQVRHHKLPTRKQANKPLIREIKSESDPNIKYKLTIKFELASGESWPSGVTQLSYTYSTSQQFYINSYLTQDMLGKDIIIYDDTNQLATVFAGGPDLPETAHMNIHDYSQLKPFLTDGTLTVTENYDPAGYQVPVFKTDRVESDIFGISLTNIEKPHPDVVGFYIVRHERLDTDKCVIDNAFFGMNAKKDDFRAFGLMGLKMEDKWLDDRSVWFWSPDHQFLRKYPQFEFVDIQWGFDENEKHLPLGSREAAPGAWVRMAQVEDVYPGTSYSADLHKKNQADDDGFSLFLSYRTFVLVSGFPHTPVVFPQKREIIYLDACSNRVSDGSVYYNMSCDNKIGMLTFDAAFDKSIFNFSDTGGVNNDRCRWLYGSLMVDNKACFSDFMYRPYYKAHNNPFLFEDSTDPNLYSGVVRVFAGDASVNSLNFISSVFFEQRIADRDKKDKTWQIIGAAALIVVGVVVGVFTAGAGLAIAAVGATIMSLAISYGVSLALSGIKFEQMKNMIDNDYPKGLLDLIKDQDTMLTTSANTTWLGPLPVPHEITDASADLGDDAFIWHDDRLQDIWVESCLPFALRSGVTTSITDFIDAPSINYDPEEFKHYLINKFTVIDQDKGQGRLYKGYPTAEFYDMNPDYLRINKQTEHQHLPIEYECCLPQDLLEAHPVRVRYSEESFQEEKLDNYGVFLPNNYRDIQGEFGEITGMYTIANQLFLQTKGALWRLPASKQERVTGQVVTFIGTGTFFEMPPVRVSEDHLISGGTEHKWSTVKTKAGVVSASEAEGKVHLHDGQNVKEISDVGMSKWFHEHLKSYLADQMEIISGKKFPLDVNPANPDGVGIHATYDGELERVIITKRDYVLLQTEGLEIIDKEPLLLGQRVKLPNLGGFYRPYYSYDKLSGLFYRGVDEQDINGDIYRTITQLHFTDGQFFENKSWTVSFSIIKSAWRSFHSYLPLIYISKPKSFYSLIDNRIWRHNAEGSYQTFFGIKYPHILEYVTTPSPLLEKTWVSLRFYTTAVQYAIPEREYYDVNVTFNKLIAFNHKQSTPEWILAPKGQEPDMTYMGAQVSNLKVGEIPLSREGHWWNVNDLRDYRIDYGSPIFKSDWFSIIGSYPIDKVLNSPTIDYSKSWMSLESLRSYYLVLRLTFDNFDNVRLTTNYVIDTEHQSIT